jgi:hypothetical protein
MESSMKVRVIRQFLDGPRKRVVHDGEELDVDERRARQLMNHRPPLIVPMNAADMPPEPQEKTAADKGEDGAEAGAADPTENSADGGPTGENKPASSSRRGRRRQTQESTEPEGESGSSQ